VFALKQQPADLPDPNPCLHIYILSTGIPVGLALLACGHGNYLLNEALAAHFKDHFGPLLQKTCHLHPLKTTEDLKLLDGLDISNAAGSAGGDDGTGGLQDLLMLSMTDDTTTDSSQSLQDFFKNFGNSLTGSTASGTTSSTTAATDDLMTKLKNMLTPNKAPSPIPTNAGKIKAPTPTAVSAPEEAPTTAAAPSATTNTWSDILHPMEETSGARSGYSSSLIYMLWAILVAFVTWWPWWLYGGH